MTRKKKSQSAVTNTLRRRQFCKITTCAIGGMLPLNLFAGISDCRSGDCSNKVNQLKREIKMKKKIKAVEVKVISQKGHCEVGHKLGDTTTFTESGVEGKICIHALYSMIPGVFAMMYEAQFSWLRDPDKKTHACPDAYNPVIFEISRIRQK